MEFCAKDLDECFNCWVERGGWLRRDPKMTGYHLRRRRLELGLSEAAVAKLVSANISDIRSIERGSRIRSKFTIPIATELHAIDDPLARPLHD